LTLPEALIPNDELPGDRSLRLRQRASLLRVLNAGVRSAASPAATRSLRRVRDALRADRLDIALRELDRAWRCVPGDAATLAPIYGRLLSLDAADDEAALHLLRRAIDFTPDPDVAALIALALLRLQRLEEAQRQLQAALAAYGIAADGLLAQIAGEVMQHAALETPGWVGRGPHLELVGALNAGETSSVLDIRLDGQAPFTQLLRSTSGDGRRPFSLQLPQLRLNTTVEMSCRGVPLLGSGARTPPDFAIDARAASSGRCVSGWARVGWLPTRPVRLRFEDENGHRGAAKTSRAALPSWRWPFQFDRRAAGLHGSRIQISAQGPDGGWQPLPDSPLLLEPAVRLAGRNPVRLSTWRARPSRVRRGQANFKRAKFTDVIIPVYRGREETLACIDAVLTTIDHAARIVVIDDATEDPLLAGALDALAATGRITLLRNPDNQGFAASVNRGLALNLTHDAVLLNSDTRVFDDWLMRLRRAAYSAPAVGTVTPLSNSGSIASYPGALSDAFDPAAGAALHALAASTHPGGSVEIPVGVGFCLYVRRDCLRDVGNLDAGVFGKGYGEETDFCLRARRRGWSHRLAADVFVYHAGGLSFAGRRAALLDRSQRLINLRHPGYDRFIASFLAQDPLQPLRRRLDERRLSGFEGRFVLLVTLGLAGGVDRFVTERCRNLRGQGLFPLLLRPAAGGNVRRCELWTDAIEVPNLHYDIPADLSALTAILGAVKLDAIEIQHFLHLDARVIDAVRSLALPFDVFIHDYAWICPRVTLIDGSGRYCGEPAVSVCQVCVRRNGSNLGEPISVPALRARGARWLRAARRVIAPSADTAARLRRYFSDLEVQVQPHTVPVVPTPRPLRATTGKVIRIALIGAIGEHKGYRILLDCARDARARRLPIEFIVIGYTQDDAPLLKTGKVFITGRYGEAEAPHLLRREQPEIAWLPSVGPETWSYTLDYALAAELPVLAFDLGAIAERLRAVAGGALLPLERDARQINDQLLQLAQQRRLTSITQAGSVQMPRPRRRDDANIAGAQSDEMHMTKTSEAKAKPKTPETKPEVQEAGLSASVQVLPLPPGLYLFSVTSVGPIPARTSDQLSLPAVQVGLGPGVRSEQVEFITGPSTQGAWLFAPGDLLVAKVIGAGATLILTSVRAPGGQVLAIKVERLDARADASASAAGAVLPATDDNKAPAKTAGKLSTLPPGAVPVQIGAHIRSRGDMIFVDVPWAGRVAPGLWIESFSIRPLDRFGAQDIEYKGLTGSGFETPWVSEEKMCGTKGMAVPLVGFAVRLKPSAAAAAYDCEYSGYFQSGVTVGPLRNGAPCRSTVANDALEGIQVHVVKRSAERPPNRRP
jgi:GT2 family glycosyltransferase